MYSWESFVTDITVISDIRLMKFMWWYHFQLIYNSSSIICSAQAPMLSSLKRSLLKDSGTPHCYSRTYTTSPSTYGLSTFRWTPSRKLNGQTLPYANVVMWFSRYSGLFEIPKYVNASYTTPTISISGIWQTRPWSVTFDLSFTRSLRCILSM